MAKSAVTLRSGWIVLPSVGASGGISYHREEIDTKTRSDGSEEKTWTTQRIVDNPEMCKRVDAVRHHVEYALRKYCSKTAFGWFAHKDQLKQLRAEAENIAREGDNVNNLARAEGCARRVHVAVVVTKLDLGSPDAAREVAWTVRDVLHEGRELLREGVVGKLEPLLVRNKNLAQLGVGITATLIEDALAELKGARKRIRERIKAGMTPESAGKQEDYAAIESAIDFFSPLEATEHDD